MLRIVLVNLLLFLLPFLLYAIYAWFKRDGATGAAILDDAPIAWLLTAGAALVLGVIVYFISFEGGKPGQTYHPAVVRDGKIEPGHID